MQWYQDRTGRLMHEQRHDLGASHTTSVGQRKTYTDGPVHARRRRHTQIADAKRRVRHAVSKREQRVVAAAGARARGRELIEDFGLVPEWRRSPDVEVSALAERRTNIGVCRPTDGQLTTGVDDTEDDLGDRLACFGATLIPHHDGRGVALVARAKSQWPARYDDNHDRFAGRLQRRQHGLLIGGLAPGRVVPRYLPAPQPPVDDVLRV